jgi:hypothetical protein
VTLNAQPRLALSWLLNLTDVKEAAKILREMSISVLNQIRNVPQKVDPRRTRELEAK